MKKKVPVSSRGDFIDVVAVLLANRGVVGTIRNMTPMDGFPSLVSTGTERER